MKRNDTWLLPLNDLSAIDDGWLSTGDDPYFVLRTRESLKSGNYRIQARLTLPAEVTPSAALYIDYGKGYSDDSRIDLEVMADGVIISELTFDMPPISIRFDPCTCPGPFSIEYFRVDSDVSFKTMPDSFPLRFKHWFMRRLGLIFSPSLIPAHQLLRLNRMWISQGEDPFFQLSFKRLPSAGWYMAEVLLLSDKPETLGKFYVDYGQGLSETNAHAINLSSGRVSKRLIYLADTPMAIRFDPCECPAHIFECKVNLKKVSEQFALSRLKRKLDNFSDSSDEQIGIEQQYRRYSSVFVSKQSQDQSVAYKTYIDSESTLRLSDSKVASIIEQVGEKLLFSVLMPTYNTEPAWLQDAVNSLLDQSYTNWELCIADDCSDSKATISMLNELAKHDSRIRVSFREKNGNISAASNTSLSMAKGQFVVLMDHDDILAPDALIEVAKVILDHPDVKFIYSDEDKLDDQGNRYDPYFKPDWNPDLFYAQNYLNHLTVLDTDHLRNSGGWRLGYEGAQDHDLYLRFTKGLASNQLYHIPRVLYHWRAVSGSTAKTLSEKSYAVQRGLKAVQDFFADEEPKVEVSMLESAPHFRVKYPIPTVQPLVSLIIPTKDMGDLVRGCVTSIFTHTDYKNFEIIIVNNNSEKEETFALFSELTAKYENLRVIDYNHPFNFSAINNYAVTQAKGEIVGLINNDIVIISDGWLSEMVSHALRPEIGCVGAKLYFDDDTIQHAGVVLGIGGVAGHSHKYFQRKSPGYFNRLLIPHSVSAVTAACLLVRKSIYVEVGGLNEDDLTVAFNDVDFCLKVMTAGYRNFWTPFAEAYHLESKSRGAEDTSEKQKRFKQEVDYMVKSWANLLENDPYYSSMLSNQHEDYSIKVIT